MGHLKFLLEKQKRLDIIVCVFLAVWIGFIPLSFGVFNEIAEDILTNAGADSVSVGRVSAALFRGVKIEDVFVYKQINARENYTVEISRVNIKCNPLRLLFSRKYFESDRDIFMEFNDKPLELAGEAANFVNTLKFIKGAELENANIRFQNRNTAGIRIENVSAKINRRHRALRGGVRVGEVIVPSLAKIENFEIKLHLNAAGASSNGNRLHLFDGNGEIFDGKINMELFVNLDENLIIGGTLSVRELDMRKACTKINLLQGSIDGRVNIDANFEQSAFSIDLIRLRGSFSATQVLARDLALQRISLLRRIPQIRTLEFDEVSGNFSFSGGLNNGRINFQEMAGRGEAMIFNSHGWFRLDGRMNKNLNGEMSRKFIDELPRIMRNSFEITENGKGHFSCTVSGTFDNPQVRVERTMVRNAVRNTFGGNRRRQR